MNQSAAEFEEQRHRCEVASIVRLYREQGKKPVIELLSAIEAGKRGKAARDKLEAEAMAVILAANSS